VRHRTGEGQHIDMSLLDVGMAILANQAGGFLNTGKVPQRQGNSHPTLFPYNAFEAADGHVVIAAFSDGHWRELCEAMDRPDLAAEYPDAASRVRARDELGDEIGDWTRSQTEAAIVELLDGRVPAAPVQDAADVFDDPHVHARDMLADVPQPGADTDVTVAGCPIKFADTETGPRGRAPLLDEHRDELLGDRARPRASGDD